MRYYEIIEARKNPELNPKVSINQVLQDRLRDTTNEVVPGQPNLFISFTGVDKLGINPQSKYNTPLGIYAYPAKYASEILGDYDAATSLPFAGDSPYANLFNARGNIVDVSNMSLDQNIEYGKKMAEIWAKVSEKSWKESVDEVESIINDAEDNARFRAYPGGQFWYTTMRVSEKLLAKKWGIKDSVAWNKLFRLLGIDGVIDTGIGIVHTSEPTQAVFFSISPIQNVQRVNNKYSPSDIEVSKQEGERKQNKIKSFLELSPDEIEYAFNSYQYDKSFIKYVRDPALRLKIIENDPSIISYMKKTTDEEQILVLKNYPPFYKYIKDRRIKNLLAVLHDAIAMRKVIGPRDMPDIFEVMSPPEKSMIIRKYPQYIEYDPKISKQTVAAAIEGYDVLPRWMPGLAKKFGVAINKPIESREERGSSDWDDYIRAAEGLKDSFDEVVARIKEFEDKLAEVPVRYERAPFAIPMLTRDYNNKIDAMKKGLEEIKQRYNDYLRRLQHI